MSTTEVYEHRQTDSFDRIGRGHAGVDVGSQELSCGMAFGAFEKWPKLVRLKGFTEPPTLVLYQDRGNR